MKIAPRTVHLAALAALSMIASACGSEVDTPKRDANVPDAILGDSSLGGPDGAVATEVSTAGAAEAGETADAEAAAPGDGSAADASPALLGVAPVGLAVLHQGKDRKSMLLSLVDPATSTLVHDNCLNSGSKPSRLSQALSGDVVLPSAPLPGNPLILIDRENDGLVWVNPDDCSVIRDVSVRTGFHPNPHDVAATSTAKVYVTRYQTNPKATANPDDFDEGGDLLILDAGTGAALGRIDLAAWAAGGPAISADPDRAIALGDRLFVTLNDIAGDFSVVGPGRLVIVDTHTDQVVEAVDLPGLKDCSVITAISVQPATLAVSCGGDYQDTANPTGSSGVAIVDVSVSPALVRIVPASSFGRTLSWQDLAFPEPSWAVAITPGDYSGTPPDQLWSLDLSGNTPHKLLDAATDYVLGGLVVYAPTHRLYVADANGKEPTLHVFDITDPAAPVELPKLSTNPSNKLLPRYAGLY